MQWQHVGHRIKGFYAIAKYVTRHLEMASEKAEHKLKVLKFWEEYGLEAARSAFGVSRRTLYLWKNQQRSGRGLEEHSKRPKRVRQRQWSGVILDEIQRLTKEHPNLGKEKLYPLLLTFCEARQLRCPKPRTIGRIMASYPHKMRQIPQKLTPKGKRKERLYYAPNKRKPKQFKALFPGHCVAFEVIASIQDVISRNQAVTMLFSVYPANQQWSLYLGQQQPLYNTEGMIIGVSTHAFKMTHTHIHPALLTLFIEHSLKGSTKIRQGVYQCLDSDQTWQLPARQGECLFWLLRKKSAKEIATLLNLSVRTVEYYTDLIKQKFAVKTLRELLDMAETNGMANYIPQHWCTHPLDLSHQPG